MSKRRKVAIIVPSPVRDLADHALLLDPVLHHRIRLYVCAQLVQRHEISFIALQRLLGLTPGNLGYQIGVLEQAGYIAVQKAFQNRQPVTSYRLTPAGQQAWGTYRSHLNAVLQTAPAQGEEA